MSVSAVCNRVFPFFFLLSSLLVSACNIRMADPAEVVVSNVYPWVVKLRPGLAESGSSEEVFGSWSRIECDEPKFLS